MTVHSTKIKILPKEVYTRIAAGEVIERPANVVKELIENSIDAGSDEIVVEVVSAGKKLIRVTDNGCGMSKEDLVLSIKPHATSKICNFEDIYNLSTLGFRGEALASIVSVSKTKIVSKQKEEPLGNQIVVYAGEIISVSECAANDGTTVEVKDLFYNTPARLKFLKSDYTERIHIIHTVEEYAIAYKNISFKLYSDNDLVFSVKKTDNVRERLKEILKKSIVDELIYFEYKDKVFDAYGFISPVELSQVNKTLQMFFVNNRPITSRSISQMLYDAYKDSLPTGRHPIGIIFLNLNPQMIDVNIHPTKRMVKFENELYIYEKLKDAIRPKIKRQFSPTKFSAEFKESVQQTSEEIKEDRNISNVQQDFLLEKNLDKADKVQEFKFEYLTDDNLNKLGLKNYVYLGQLHKTYLLFETNNGLTLIDQHAASERILYEKFMNSDFLSSQKLLFPINLELKPSDYEAVKPYVDLINQLGFEVSISGRSSLGFYSIPSVLNVDDVRDFVFRFIENLVSEIKSDEKQKVSSKEKIIRSACRAAIKSSDILTLSDVEKLISELAKCEQPFSCPHGRPTILNIEISQIEKMFLRRK